MIINEAPIDNAWFRAAAVWFGSLFLLTVVSGVLYETGLNTGLVSLTLRIGIFGTLFLILFGFIFRQKPKRLLYYILIIGCFGMVPFAVSSIIISFSYYYLPQNSSCFFLIARLILPISVLAYCYSELTKFRKLIITRKFIEKEFKILDDFISIKRMPKTDLNSPPINENSFLGRLYYKLGPKLVLLVFCGYPLQRLFADSAGPSSVLLLISLLGIPMVFYILGRLTCGTYLYVYKVWLLERKHGKPVLFS